MSFPRPKKTGVPLKPDHVWGLSQTSKFTSALEAHCIRGITDSNNTKRVEEIISSSPYPTSDKPLLFPFLVAEAKQEKTLDTVSDIEKQSAFSIRTSLKKQKRLFESVKEDLPASDREPIVPLVWFFAWKGDEWHLYIGYAEDITGAIEPNNFKSVIVEIWSGHISNRESALHLLLLIDYIVDWGRDIYRPRILSYLRILSIPDIEKAMSIGPDSNIFSLRPTESWMRCGRQDADSVDWLDSVEDDPPDIPSNSNYNILILKGLYITADNLNTLLYSFETESQAQDFCVTVLQFLRKGSLRMNGDEILRLVERAWAPYHQPRIPYSGEVYVLMSFSYYFNIQWDLIRELSFLAVTQEALDRICDISQKKRTRSRDIKTESIHLMLRSNPLRRKEIFTAAIERTTYAVDVNAPRSAYTSYFNGRPALSLYPIESDQIRPCHIQMNSCKYGDSKTFRITVLSMHEKYRIGRRDLEEPFLWKSKRYGMDPIFEGNPSLGSAADNVDGSMARLEKQPAIVRFLVGDFISSNTKIHKGFPPLCIYILGDAGCPVTHRFLSMALQHWTCNERFPFTVREGRPGKSNRKLPMRVDGVEMTPAEISSVDGIKSRIPQLQEPNNIMKMMLEWVETLTENIEGDSMLNDEGLLLVEISKHLFSCCNY
ncbi:hypothetical protein K469DRAFT_697687 [Zopfia rhizophila CBS 207.26]|uniref:Uncharacterized protein n=1 Tax=Zopfia rhizophila CBS 207.26 TaxID=1314779 RepID=A0A6A6EIA5_9PEZI|nr:hypothetical protein K469DRAFT_697687 [Zopfia rhizophila CBS 207.26]